MNILIICLVGLVAALHLYFMYFEMFAWLKKGPKLVGSRSKEFFQDTKTMAANQGLYNGFLAAGLIWTFFIQNVEWQGYIRVFFLCCIILAGIYGAVTVSKRIAYIQALPAFIALVLVVMNLV